MKNFEQIAATPEALGAFLASLPVADGPWDTEFRRIFCAACSAENCDGDNCPHSTERNNPLWWLIQAADKQKEETGSMTDHERRMVKQAAHSVITATSMYCELLEKRMKKSDGSVEQIQEIGDSLRALNHTTVAMERLCRILEGTGRGTAGEDHIFSHSDKPVGTSSI